MLHLALLELNRQAQARTVKHKKFRLQVLPGPGLADLADGSESYSADGVLCLKSNDKRAPPLLSGNMLLRWPAGKDATARVVENEGHGGCLHPLK